MAISLFFSPCPNDTFCFHAMVSGLVDTEGLSFEPVLEDVEQLNQRVLNQCPDVCKVSYRLVPEIVDRYQVLPCGSALGFGNGPLLVARHTLHAITSQTRIAIPGVHTTAAFLLSFAYPQAGNTHPVLFSEVANAVVRGEFDAGVLIHEGRFMYKQQGLSLIVDLGQRWEERTGLPIPLGGIVVSRTLDNAIRQKIARVLYRSIRYAQEHPTAGDSYIRSHAQEMDSDVIRKHIELFVNDYTLDLGATGRIAVESLFAQDPRRERGACLNCAELFVPLFL